MKKILDQYLNFISDRHTFLVNAFLNNQKIELINEINLIEAEKTFLQTKLTDREQFEFLKVIDTSELKYQANDLLEYQANDFYNFLSEYVRYSDRLFNLNQRNNFLKSELDYLGNTKVVNSQYLTDIITKTIDPKISLIVILGFIIGSITGIILVFLKSLL